MKIEKFRGYNESKFQVHNTRAFKFSLKQCQTSSNYIIFRHMKGKCFGKFRHKKLLNKILELENLGILSKSAFVLYIELRRYIFQL